MPAGPYAPLVVDASAPLIDGWDDNFVGKKLLDR